MIEHSIGQIVIMLLNVHTISVETYVFYKNNLHKGFKNNLHKGLYCRVLFFFTLSTSADVVITSLINIDPKVVFVANLRESPLPGSLPTRANIVFLLISFNYLQNFP